MDDLFVTHRYACRLLADLLVTLEVLNVTTTTFERYISEMYELIEADRKEHILRLRPQLQAMAKGGNAYAKILLATEVYSEEA